MGKRKLNGTSYYQCDWTGFPMKQAYCYWPSWSASGKLFKKGSYCTWEAVVAHAEELLAKGSIAKDEHEKVTEHVTNLTGTVVETAPHYLKLEHTKGTMKALDFHKECARQKHPITGVKISPDGDVFEVLLHPDPEGAFCFGHFLHKPFSYHGPPSTFHSMRKKGGKNTDRDLSVWYYPVKDLPHNPHASNLFKMQLYGDVLLVQQSREQSFMPRERFDSADDREFGQDGIAAPMPGKIIRLLVAQGDTVEAGQPLVILEAMKMEHVMKAARSGVVTRVHCDEGSIVADGATLVELGSDEETEELSA